MKSVEVPEGRQSRARLPYRRYRDLMQSRSSSPLGHAGAARIFHAVRAFLTSRHGPHTGIHEQRRIQRLDRRAVQDSGPASARWMQR